ncbi:hypothetical protein A6R68_20548 [Neotoma lepida]|uniref:Uncharacterized protein n=1 Tax=Neotoma lepida TaxID=56216 RepID=A0A1A6HS13_NEOLE|nr:hypothetical protein A6R68_20548 [Neotoma lepida]
MQVLVEETPMSPNQSSGLTKQTIWKEMCQQLGIVMMTI